MAERIGIVLVHGIGEQKRFEHLSGEVREIVRALQADKNNSHLSVHPRESQDAPYLGEHSIWRAEGEAPLRIDFLHAGVAKSLFVHEVWWADLDNKGGLWAKIRFWLWALGAWNFVPFNASSLPGAQKMRLPAFASGEPCQSLCRDRLRLFFVGIVFFLLLLAFLPLTYLARRIGITVPGPDIIYRYLGDVKLFQDFAKPGEGVLSAIGQPPRVPIRRRMVETLIDVYFADYDRWYVAAHSLGTVVAWNGLMETAHCLPNYLHHALWERCKVGGLGGSDAGELGATDAMRPPRPAWLGEQDVIFREKLFAKLRGLVTYGSPLDKFACMWGPIVPINAQQPVFANAFEWINVYDLSDPVAAKLEAFDAARPAPANYCYKALPVLLLSHLRYLTFKDDRPDCFVNRFTQWLIGGEAFPVPQAGDPSWVLDQGGDQGILSRGLWWTGLAIMLALLDGWFLSLFAGSLFINALLITLAAIAAVSASGMVLKIRENRLNR